VSSIALIRPPDGALTGKLRERGLCVEALSPPGSAALDQRVLGMRGFTVPLSHLPALAWQLRRRRFDVHHAFSAQDAFVARRAGGRLVYTCMEMLDRSNVADARLRALMLRTAIEDSWVLLAPSEAVAASIQRWYAVTPRLVDPSDDEALEHIYRAAG
jgi:hypothetical protein